MSSSLRSSSPPRSMSVSSMSSSVSNGIVMSSRSSNCDPPTTPPMAAGVLRGASEVRRGVALFRTALFRAVLFRAVLFREVLWVMRRVARGTDRLPNRSQCSTRTTGRFASAAVRFRLALASACLPREPSAGGCCALVFLPRGGRLQSRASPASIADGEAIRSAIVREMGHEKRREQRQR